MAWFMGMDIGSVYSKGVITHDNELSAFHVIRSGANYRATAEKIREELLAKFNLGEDHITRTAATGSGAGNVHSTLQNQCRAQDQNGG